MLAVNNTIGQQQGCRKECGHWLLHAQHNEAGGVCAHAHTHFYILYIHTSFLFGPTEFVSTDLLLQTLLLLLQDVGDVISLCCVFGMPSLLLLQICYYLQPPPRGDTES